MKRAFVIGHPINHSRSPMIHSYWLDLYGIHGTYWHHNFGTPMSHGCVNMLTEDAGWLYDWASIGTVVYIRN